MNREEGLTVVIVTHEPDIAAATHRVVSMRDGRLISDQPVKEPHLVHSGGPEYVEVSPGIRMQPVREAD